MKKIFFTGVFLVTIISTVSANKNVSKELQNSNVTANKNGTSINKIKREKYNSYVDPDVQKVWEMYLAQVPESTQYKEITYKMTPAMGKESVVTETIKAFRERGNNIEREAASNINITPTPGARPYRIGKNRTVNVMRRRATKRIRNLKDPYEDDIFREVNYKPDEIKFERFHQPYWPGGEYVFLRTGSPTTGKAKLMVAFRGCDRSCNYYFLSYGRVCGHRWSMRTYKNDYKTFDNMCDMDHENCKDPRRKLYWHPMYRGNCTELLPFPWMHNGWEKIVSHAQYLHTYKFTRRTVSPSTLDAVDLEIIQLQKEQKNSG